MSERLFDEVEFAERFCLIRVSKKSQFLIFDFLIFDLEYVEQKYFVKKVKDFIDSSILSAQKQAIKEFAEKIKLSKTICHPVPERIAGYNDACDDLENKINELLKEWEERK